MRLAFVTNICAHYRIKTFEELARRHQVDFYFFSADDEWYWQREHGVRSGAFSHRYLRGFRLWGTRIALGLPWHLLRGDYDVYVKCINGRFALPITYLIARLRHRPLVLWTGIWMRLRSPAHRLFFPLTRHVYRNAQAVVVYGEHVKRYLVTEGVAPDRIFVAHHSVDNSAYSVLVPTAERDSLREILGLGRNDKVILYLGRLENGKGLDYLMEAFAQVQDDDAVLVIAGVGALRPRLEQKADALHVTERVRFPGYIQPSETVAFYSLAWVYVLPSVTTALFKEPWGLVVNEAFNQGVPVIATDAVGAAAGGLIQDGVNGFIVPERNAAALANAVSRVLSDRHLRQVLGENARRIVAEWNNERMVDGFCEAIAFAAQKREK